VIRRLVIFLLATAAFWLVVALPARAKAGNEALILSGTAALLCLVPTTLTLAWASWALRRAREEQLITVLGGTALRLATVIIGAWLLSSTVGIFGDVQRFSVWLLIFYFYTLAAEVTLVLWRRPGTEAASATSQAK
jgi:hypothetical protein